jgi:hypothetical protein
MISKQNKIFEIEANFSKFRSSGSYKQFATEEKFLLENGGQLPRPLKSTDDLLLFRSFHSPSPGSYVYTVPHMHIQAYSQQRSPCSGQKSIP